MQILQVFKIFIYVYSIDLNKISSEWLSYHTLLSFYHYNNIALTIELFI